LRGDLDHIAVDGSLTVSSLPAISWNSPRKSATSCKVYVRWSAMPHGMRNRLPDRERRPAAVAPDRPNGGRRCHSDQPARQISARMNAPGSETGPGPQLVTWGKSTILSVHPHGFKFEYTLNSAKLSRSTGLGRNERQMMGLLRLVELPLPPLPYSDPAARSCLPLYMRPHDLEWQFA